MIKSERQAWAQKEDKGPKVHEGNKATEGGLTWKRKVCVTWKSHERKMLKSNLEAQLSVLFTIL